MNDLLKLVLDAHGGLERWRQVRQLTAHAHVGGELWGRRGQEGILNDAHLEGIADRRPESLAELARCTGIGPTKLERYGDEIIAVIADS